MAEFNYLNRDLQDELRCIAQKLVAPGKGILAADESPTGMGERLGKINVENSEENRRLYRQLLFTTDPKISEYISGVILDEETVSKKSDDGTPFITLLKQRNILAGINVDKGLVPLGGTVEETTTQGLDDLAMRCAKFKAAGCEFAKWRAQIKIGKGIPTTQAIEANAIALAQYAMICQQNRIVPIVEPEVSAEGDHDLERAQKVSETVLPAVFKALYDSHVYLEGIILKLGMVIPGLSSSNSYTTEQIAQATVECMRRTVPPAILGISFLSGGQSEEAATINLNAINNVDKTRPWPMTFCYGRALQTSALRAWGGKPENVKAGQDELMRLARDNSLASQGKYTGATKRPTQQEGGSPKGCPCRKN